MVITACAEYVAEQELGPTPHDAKVLMLPQAESFCEAANPYGQRVCDASTQAVTDASRTLDIDNGRCHFGTRCGTQNIIWWRLICNRSEAHNGDVELKSLPFQTNIVQQLLAMRFGNFAC